MSPPPAFQMDNFSSTAKLTDSKTSVKAPPEKAALDYDPFAERDVQHPTSDAGALAHILKASLGSGILAMPNAFRNGGLIFGMVATLLVGYVCTHTVQMLVRCSYQLSSRCKVPSLDFAETAEKAFETGPARVRGYATAAKNFVNGALMATYYSVSCVYVVFVAESLMQVCSFYIPEVKDWDIRIYMVIIVVPLILLCLLPNLRYLVPFSIVANGFIVIGFVITLYYMFSDIPALDERKNMAPLDQLPLFFSTVIFAMEGIGMVLPVANSMKNPSHFLSCPGVLNIAMVVVVSLYAVIGFFGYLKYGEVTKGSVTLNLPIEQPAAQVVKVLIALAMVCTYGLLLYVPNTIVLDALRPRLPARWVTPLQYGFKVAVVLASVSIAAAVPNLGPIISLVGAVFVSTLGLFCPAVIETVMHWESGLGYGKWKLYKNLLIVLFSLFALVTGSYSSILEILDTYTSHEV